MASSSYAAFYTDSVQITTTAETVCAINDELIC